MLWCAVARWSGTCGAWCGVACDRSPRRRGEARWMYSVDADLLSPRKPSFCGPATVFGWPAHPTKRPSVPISSSYCQVVVRSGVRQRNAACPVHCVARRGLGGCLGALVTAAQPPRREGLAAHAQAGRGRYQAGDQGGIRGQPDPTAKACEAGGGGEEGESTTARAAAQPQTRRECAETCDACSGLCAGEAVSEGSVRETETNTATSSSRDSGLHAAVRTCWSSMTLARTAARQSSVRRRRRRQTPVTAETQQTAFLTVCTVYVPHRTAPAGPRQSPVSRRDEARQRARRRVAWR